MRKTYGIIPGTEDYGVHQVIRKMDRAEKHLNQSHLSDRERDILAAGYRQGWNSPELDHASALKVLIAKYKMHFEVNPITLKEKCLFESGYEQGYKENTK